MKRPEVGDLVTIAFNAQGYAKKYAGKTVSVVEILESQSGVRVDPGINTPYGNQPFTVWWSELVDETITIEQVLHELFNISCTKLET